VRDERTAARGVKTRRKPGRSGESHEHASSDTGGGLLEIPREPGESTAYDRGREHSFDGRRPGPARAVVFDETAEKAGSGGPVVTGLGSRAGLTKGRDRGRQRQRRRLGARSKIPCPGRHGAEGPSIVAPPGLRRAAHVDVRGKPPHAPSGDPSGITWWLRRGPKQEVRRQAKLHLVGASGKRFGRLPCLAAARPRAQDEPAFAPCAAMRTAAQRCAGAT